MSTIDFQNARTTRPKVAAALRELERRGKITPERVFEAAATDVRLHDLFEWDKGKAWRAYNLDIAATLIRTVRYIKLETDHGLVSPPVYVRDPSLSADRAGSIALRELAAKRGPTARAVVMSECDQAISHLKRAQAIAATLGLSSVLARAIEQVLNIKTRASGVASHRSAGKEVEKRAAI